MTAAPAHLADDLNLAVAGQGGDGSLTVSTLVARLLGARGFHLYSARSVASRIKGGHAAALLRGSITQRGCVGDRLQILVAFDEEAVERLGPRLAEGGMVVFDASGGPVPTGFLPAGAEVIDVPFARMAVRDHRRDLYKNSVAFGIVTRILGVPDAEAAEVLRSGFSRLPSALLEANQAALAGGFAVAAERGLSEGSGRWALDRADGGPRLLMSGNEAIALGFLAAGGRFFTGYPITPASEILDWLSSRLPEFGGVAVQAEDELSAINMAMGAALTGVRAMTATSGPGIALMQEGVSHLGAAEIPLVVVDCQRAGPSTGMPTKIEQSDLGMLVHGGNGDIPRLVLTPSDPSDCFQLSVAATGLARRLQCPVYIAIDQALAQHPTTVDPFDPEVAIEPGSVLSDAELSKLGEYRRYLVTEDGVSPWALPGTKGGMSLVTGNEHDEWGHVSTEPENRRAMMEKRQRKIEAARGSFPEGVSWGDPDAELGVVAVGSVVAPLREAMERLGLEGVAITAHQPRTLWPLTDATRAFLGRARTITVEHSHQAQLAAVLRSSGAVAGDLDSITRSDGQPFDPGDLAERLKRAVAS